MQGRSKVDLAVTVGREGRVLDVIRDQDPLILSPEMTVMGACQEMHRRRVGAALVAKPDQRLLGIFTGRDVVCHVVARGWDPKTATLAQAMTARPATMAPDGTAAGANQSSSARTNHIPPSL
jgi:CBS domain-containing protein